MRYKWATARAFHFSGLVGGLSTCHHDGEIWVLWVCISARTHLSLNVTRVYKADPDFSKHSISSILCVWLWLINSLLFQEHVSVCGSNYTTYWNCCVLKCLYIVYVLSYFNWGVHNIAEIANEECFLCRRWQQLWKQTSVYCATIMFIAAPLPLPIKQ